MLVMRRAFICARLAILSLVAACCLGSAAAQAPDPLPSWNDGAVKRSIADFVPRDHARRRGLRAGRSA
jgi:hypothetical protein